jgi:hypothetical protein
MVTIRWGGAGLLVATDTQSDSLDQALPAPRSIIKIILLLMFPPSVAEIRPNKWITLATISDP